MDEERDKTARGRARGRSRGSLIQVPEEGNAGGSSSISSNGIGNGVHSSNGNGNGSTNRGATGRVTGSVAVSRGFRTEMPDFCTSRPDGFDKKGSSGITRRFLANYYEFQSKKSAGMRLYRVTFEPETDILKVRKELLRRKEADIGPYLFDGTQLFTTKEYQPENMNFQVWLENKPEDVFLVKIIFVRMVTTLEPLAFQLYNVLIRKCQYMLDLDLLGRNFFDRSQKINIPQHQIELWPGYKTTMRQQETETLLNVDMTFKVCRTDHVYQLMVNIRQNHPAAFRELCEAAIVGTIVMTKFNRKTYRVDAIEWDKKPIHTFPRIRKGVTTDISFLDYYNEKGVVVKYPNQPMLISRPRERDIRRGDTGDKLLIPEMCFQTGLNDEMRGNFLLMKDVASHLHMTPGHRLNMINQFIDRLKSSPQVEQEMLQWGIRFRTDPIEVDGRRIPLEEIIFKNGPFTPNDQADWSLAFRSKQMLTSARLRTWVIICTSRDSQGMQNLIQTMNRVATPLGYVIDRPEVIIVNDSSTRGFVQKIRETVAKFQGKIDMVMIILPTNKLETYAAVKVACSIDYGIPSQCFLSKNVRSKGLMSICTKLVIQMNAKQGGEPWTVKNPLKGMMIVGFDVYHGVGRSVGAMTATMTESLATYFSCITRQEPGMEMSSELGNAFRKCLMAYKTRNGCLPTRVMFYRDGVGVGQLSYVARAELDSLRETLKTVYTSLSQQPPKLTFVIVTKRITTRLFEVQGNNGQVGNPMPGTVVDDRITCPEKYDFFLVPQTARQGTVSPVAFNVILDESGLSPDKIQILTFKLCHLYFNWSGTVTVPAPCQYAHKLAFLTGTVLQREANQRISSLLHFL